MLNDFVLAATASRWLPLVLFAVAVIDGFFPPVPSETVLVAAVAVAASTGALPSALMLCAVAAAGALIGDNIAYGIGRRIGTTRFRWMRTRRISAAFARARDALDRRAALLILGARYIPVGRVAVNMSAGALRYAWRRFLPLSAVAAVSWAAYSSVLGAVAGHWLQDQPLVSAAVGVALALAVGLVIDRVVAARRRRAARAENARPQEDPARLPDRVVLGRVRTGTIELER